MTDERDIEKDLKPSTGDYIHTGIKAGLSTAPGIGGPIAEFFSFVIAPPLEMRRDAWLIEIYKRLQTLEQRYEEFKPENLAKNEQFFSVFLQATQIAMRTHQEEKLAALRNAVINSAISQSTDENLQLMFLNLVDRYTPLHLVLLQLLDDPQQYCKRHGIESLKSDDWTSIMQLIEKIIPNFSNDPIIPQIIKDLSSDGLLTPDMEKRIHRPIDRVSFTTSTKLGKKFLKFICTSENNIENKS